MELVTTSSVLFVIYSGSPYYDSWMINKIYLDETAINQIQPQQNTGKRGAAQILKTQAQAVYCSSLIGYSDIS